MIVGVSFNNDDFETVTNVTYSGTGLTFVGQVSQNDDARVEIWSYLNPPAVTADVVVTFNEVVQQGGGAGVITFTGVDQSNPYGAFQSDTGNSSNANMVAISAPGETVFALMAAERQDDPPVVVGGTAQWSYKTAPPNNQTAGAGATYAGATPVNVSWNLNEPDDWAVAAISLRDASATSSIGFCDDFESGLGNWTIDASGGGNAGIGSATAQSPSNSLFTRWGVVTAATTDSFTAAGTPFTLSMWIRRGEDSFSEDPDGGENLQVQYFNNLGVWTTVESLPGNGTPGEILQRSYNLPADAQHNNLRVRVRQTGGSGTDWDYWHIDDVCIGVTVDPEIEWRMDELGWNGSANEVIDSSGNGNDANANGASGLTTVDPGQICRAGDFDGIDDYIESSDIYALLSDTSSMSFWIRTTQTGNNTGWMAPGVAGVEQAGGADDIFWGWLDASGRIGISAANDYTNKSTIAVNDGTYHHVALTRDASSGDWKIYIDGSLNASGTGTSGVIGTSFSSIGRIEDTGGSPEYLEGDLDEVLIFDSVLSDSAVTTIYTNQLAGLNLDGSARACRDAPAYFNLDEASGTWNGTPGEIADQAGNFNGAFALGTGAGVDAVPARVCNGIDIPLNTSNALQYGFDTTVDIDDDIGNRGTISFWYNSNNAWQGGTRRMLVDASRWVAAPNQADRRSFFLELQNNGRLDFRFEDDSNTAFRALSAVNTFAAATWVHLAITWDMSGAREIFVNGSVVATDAAATSGQIGELNTLYAGDNRSNYHPDGTARSANGIIDEVRIYSQVQTAGEISADMNATHPCPAAHDHYYVQNGSSGINCLAENITITAHDSSHNPVDVSGTVITITADRVAGAPGTHGDYSIVTGTGILNNGTIDDGIATYTFGAAESEVELSYKNTWEQTINMSVTDGSITDTSGTAAADPGYDRDLAFAAAGFRFVDPVVPDGDLPNQSAGVTGGSYDLQAIETAACMTPGPCPGVCTVPSAFGNGSTVDIDLAFTCDDPISCQAGQQVSITNNGVTAIAANPVTGPTAWTTKTMLFGADGRAAFDMVYPDVGALSLHARYDIPLQGGGPSGNLMLGQSNSYVVAPFGFEISETAPNQIRRTSDDFPNPGATTAAGPVFMAAGEDFTVTVTAVNQSGAATPNYGQEIAPESVLLSPNLLGLPGLTNNPALLNATAFGSFSGGVATGTTFSWGEVGIITLTPSVADADYLGAGDVTGTSSGEVGRFIPAQFIVDSITNGGFGDGCGAFTYMGQDFGYDTAPTFRVVAQNLQSATTENYSDAFVKLGPSSVAVVATQDDTTPGSDAMPLLVSYGLAAMADAPNDDGTVDYVFGGDTYRYGPAAPTTFSKYANSEVPEFTSDINPEITSVDDGEASSSFAPGTYVLDPADNSNRFGRIRMTNALGSELSSLNMPVIVEYLDTAGGASVYRKSIADACTTITDSDLLNTPSGFADPSVVNSPASAGDIDYSYPAPGSAGTVNTQIRLDAANADHLWLRYDWDADGDFDDDPEATATFGVYQGHEYQIFQQQTFQ